MTKVLDMRHSVEEAVAAAEKPLLPQGISQLRSIVARTDIVRW